MASVALLTAKSPGPYPMDSTTARLKGAVWLPEPLYRHTRFVMEDTLHLTSIPSDLHNDGSGAGAFTYDSDLVRIASKSSNMPLNPLNARTLVE